MMPLSEMMSILRMFIVSKTILINKAKTEESSYKTFPLMFYLLVS